MTDTTGPRPAAPGVRLPVAPAPGVQAPVAPGAQLPIAPARLPAPASPGRDAAAPGAESAGAARRFGRAALITAVLTALGALLGLVRDQVIAHLFGAGAESDAFLVSWTVPELSSTLLIEDGLALILVPAFSMAVARGSVRALLRRTLPTLCLVLGGVSLLVLAGAPWVVDALAPGLPDHALAVDCTRSTATCVFTFGLVGYFSAALRAHSSFLAPAAVYVAYNAGIIATMLLLPARLGVRAAALGVAAGGVCMAAIQAPSLWRRVRAVRPTVPPGAVPGVGIALVAPAIVFALSRQAQVLVERFLASPLAAGAISHLNYAQKVAQLPMVLSLMLCTVTFPEVARAMAAGDTAAARRRVERDLATAAIVVLLGTAFVIACAPQIVSVLFQRGAFDAADTAATASVMRVYAFGLLGQTLVGALVRCYFSAARPLWFPALAMGGGLVLTTASGAGLVRVWGVLGIAAANALGISLTAVLLLAGLGRRSVPVRIPHVAAGLAKLSAAAGAATVAGALCVSVLPGRYLALTAASLALAVVFLAAAVALRAPEADTVLAALLRCARSVRTLTRRLADAR
ncbi:murein biosynthesis integral membrane protein MurJ [Streptomyces sp. 8L]|uniref:murein biosynthesis integral membrane protein MurJ n=1 Tax=Streptomyces sp. 8L TaxID=2877242 RepID=UPI001CD51ED6|nr:murein biosynthesis integral membrane protein MurJ [Streptomyces sp. 8L]MCA1221757.1 murein biosynthesis integral membrane protein MurJ [Streptomyces sp. 8L]